MGRPRKKPLPPDLQLLLPHIPRLKKKKAPPSPRARARKEHAGRLREALELVGVELKGLPPFIVHKGYILGTRFARALDEWRPEVLAAMVRWWIDRRHLIRQEYAYFAKGSPGLTAVWRLADTAYHERLKAALPPAHAREMVADLAARMGTGMPISEADAEAERYRDFPKPPPFALPPHLPPAEREARAAAHARIATEIAEALQSPVGRPREGPETNPARSRPRTRVWLKQPRGGV